MNFKELQTRVQNYISDSSSATLAIIKETINLKVQELLQRSFWKFAMQNDTVTTVSGTSEYYLLGDVDRIVDIRQTSSPAQLQRIWAGDFDFYVPNPTALGKPLAYMETSMDGVLAQPASAHKIIMVSTSASDIGAGSGSTMVTIYGLAGGVPRSENVSLSGANVVSGSLSFTNLYRITSDAPAYGNIRFTEEVAGTELLTLYAGERRQLFKKIQVYPIPDGAYTLYVRSQLGSPRMVNDSDSPIIPAKFADVLVNMTVAEMMAMQGDTKASAFFGLAEQGVARMMKEEDMNWDENSSIKGNYASYYDPAYPFSYF